MFKRMSVYVHKDVDIDVIPINGILSDYVLKLGDVNIMLTKDKLHDLYKKLNGVCNEYCRKK